MEAKDYLSQYYGSYDEEGRLLSPHGRVEFITTMKYIERYLRPGMRVLEIGAGTGRYSHTLAQRGYSVDAVELIESNIQIFRQNTLPGEPVAIAQGDARNLHKIAGNLYDITLVLGPMYHLFTREDQEKAFSEAVRVTMPGGVLFLAYCMGDPAIIDQGFKKGRIRELLERHMLDEETFTPHSDPCDLFQLYRREDIEALRAAQPVLPLHYIAADGYANHMRDLVDAMDNATYELYVKYHLTVCERPDMTGFSHHTLDVVCKK